MITMSIDVASVFLGMIFGSLMTVFIFLFTGDMR